jgi:hypothetical protein
MSDSGLLLMKTIVVMQFDQAGAPIAADLVQLFPPFSKERMADAVMRVVRPNTERALVCHGIVAGQLKIDEFGRR